MEKNVAVNLFYLFILLILTSLFWFDAIIEFAGLLLWFIIGIISIIVIILIYMELTRDY